MKVWKPQKAIKFKVIEGAVEPLCLLSVPVFLKHEEGSVRPAHFTAGVKLAVVKKCNKELQKSS